MKTTFVNKWSIQKQIKSFEFAFSGVKKFLMQERHAKVHLIATLLVICLSWLTRVSRAEALDLLIVIGLVWATEMINSCLEKLIDFITPHHYPQLAFVKDVAAGAVLVASFVALATALIIFIPKF